MRLLYLNEEYRRLKDTGTSGKPGKKDLFRVLEREGLLVPIKNSKGYPLINSNAVTILLRCQQYPIVCLAYRYRRNLAFICNNQEEVEEVSNKFKGYELTATRWFYTSSLKKLQQIIEPYLHGVKQKPVKSDTKTTHVRERPPLQDEVNIHQSPKRRCC